MITPEMNFVLFMRFFYLWTIKSKASFKALAFHLSMDKYPLMVQSIAVLMKVEGAVSDISQTLEGILALQNQLEVGRRLLKSLIVQLCLTFKRHIPPTNLSLKL